MISNLKSKEENKEYLKDIIGVNKRNHINWKSSVGCEIEYEYNWHGEEYSKGILKIIKYENEYIYFEGFKKGMKPSRVIGCELGGILDFTSSKFKYEIGVTVNKLTIIDKEYKIDEKGRKYKCYKYKCNKCGNVDWIRESNLKKGKSCNACSLYYKKAVLGINTIWDKARWMVYLGVSEEDAKTHTPNSNKKIKVKCPDCGRIKEIRLNVIYKRHSIGCSCKDRISYPEKLMESLLIQLGVEYKYQYRNNWSQNKIYDFYLPNYNIIIETHGEQHYEQSRRGRSLKEEQENDEFKKELALKNGIKHYIVINCSKSELEYIKNNILDSKLNELFDLSNINWNKCEEYALKNKVKEVCVYYKKHQGISTVDLAKEFSVDKSTVIKYLKQGTKLGWCKYDAKEEMIRIGKLNGKLNSKPVSQFTLKNEFIKTYSSATEAEKETGTHYGNISMCCNGKRKTAGGYIWKFAE